MEKQMQVCEVKKKMMADHVIQSAIGMSEILKTIPNTGKRKNIFIKKYNRRPRNKEKINAGMIRLQIYTASRAMGLAIIIQQPIPKYELGK